MIELRIPGVPVSQGRPRLTKEGVYNPNSEDKKKAKWLVKQQYRKKPLETPLRLDVWFLMPIPASFSKKKREDLVGKPHTIKPDLDNLLKFLDFLIGTAIKDDSQIHTIYAHKLYSSVPETKIIIHEVFT